MNSSQSSDKTAREQFDTAIYFWKLDELYTDLASVKGRALSKTEKLHLRGLLCGNSPTEIAQKLYKSVRGTESDLCSTIYHYVKILLKKDQKAMDNWRNISEWLEEAGYKIPVESDNHEVNQKRVVEIPVDKLNSLIKINQIHNNRNKSVVFEINIRVIATMPTKDKKDKHDD